MIARSTVLRLRPTRRSSGPTTAGHNGAPCGHRARRYGPLSWYVRRHAKPAVLDRLLELRPFAYHTCGTLNFESIRRGRALRSAQDLLVGSEHEYLLSIRRRHSVRVALPGGHVEIRDNAPLRLGSLELELDVTLEAFLRDLNSRVFLWPGNEHGPIRTGGSHFEHYSGIGTVHVIRVPLQHLLHANPRRELAVTYCNSGSARHHSGRKAIRGPGTFHPIERAPRPAAEIKELTFVGSVHLPEGSAFSSSPSGPWQPL